MLQLSYDPLWETLTTRGMKKVNLQSIISSAILKKLQNNEPVSLNVLMKLCETLDTSIDRVVSFRNL